MWWKLSGEYWKTISVSVSAARRLQSAVARNGLEGLQVYPAVDLSGAQLRRGTRSLMGVALQSAQWLAVSATPAPGVARSPEAEACRRAFGRLLAQAAPLAACAGNLERLRHEYRRAVRRARALQDVLLPEIDLTVHDLETRLEELEQEDAISMRRAAP